MAARRGCLRLASPCRMSLSSLADREGGGGDRFLMHRFLHGRRRISRCVDRAGGARRLVGIRGRKHAETVVALRRRSDAPKAAGSRRRAQARPLRRRSRRCRNRPASVYLMRGFRRHLLARHGPAECQPDGAGVKTRSSAIPAGRRCWSARSRPSGGEPKGAPDRASSAIRSAAMPRCRRPLRSASRASLVDLVVTCRSTAPRGLISTVEKRHLNVYMSNDGLGTPLAASGGGVDNSDIRANPSWVGRASVTSPWTNPIVQQQLLTAIMKALGRQGRGGMTAAAAPRLSPRAARRPRPCARRSSLWPRGGGDRRRRPSRRLDRLDPRLRRHLSDGHSRPPRRDPGPAGGAEVSPLPASRLRWCASVASRPARRQPCWARRSWPGRTRCCMSRRRCRMYCPPTGGGARRLRLRRHEPCRRGGRGRVRRLVMTSSVMAALYLGGRRPPGMS